MSRKLSRNAFQVHVRAFLYVLGLILLLNACGGGSSPPPTVVENPDLKTGYFLDSPVQGLTWATETESGATTALGAFQFLEDETVTFWVSKYLLGTCKAKHWVTPVQFSVDRNQEDPLVCNMARLLQSLDVNGNADDGIQVTADCKKCLDDAMVNLSFVTIDFNDTEQVDQIIAEMTKLAEEVGLGMVDVPAEDAEQHLDETLAEVGIIFRKNVSKTPALADAKAKFNIMTQYTEVRMADETPLFEEELSPEGERIPLLEKPLIITYAGEIEAGSGAFDTYLAISRDAGWTWKRLNVSRSADLSSFTLADGTVYPGTVTKPVMQIKGRYIFMAWQSKYARMGAPNCMKELLVAEYADKYGDDVEFSMLTPAERDAIDPHMVVGPQNSVDYADGVERPELGEIPYSAIWTCRAVIDKDGTIRVYKPEMLTTGRRDAIQTFAGGAGKAGFAIAWQEDPEGLRPGQGAGPGTGLAGATVNGKTDIWYSYIQWKNFDKVDEDFVPGGDPDPINDDGIGRLQPLKWMSPPVRVTDNMACRYVEEDQEDPFKGPAIGWMQTGCDLDDADCLADHTVEVETNDPSTPMKFFAQAEDGRVFDGDTGASRANLFMQPIKVDGVVVGAEALLGYEESVGLGEGPDVEERIRYGKVIRYHHFADFTDPDIVHAGTLLNQPRPGQDPDDLASYRNSRRVRFILQPKGWKGASNTVLVTIWREGEEGMGGPADIMSQRFLKTYAPSGREKIEDAFVVRNLSSTTFVTEVDPEDPEKEKVVEWSWLPANMADGTETNPYEDARAHRGQIRGDFVVMGYCYTPNQSAANRGNDKYDFYIRRSFDGGVTWELEDGPFGHARNVSNLKNHKESVIEPRIVAAPGSIVQTRPDGTTWFRRPEDKQDKSRFFVIFGTANNSVVDPNATGHDVQLDSYPMDLYYCRVRDYGETYVDLYEKLFQSTGETAWVFPWLAKGDTEQGEAQIRLTPAGTIHYATWLQEGDDPTDRKEGSDVWFRKIDDEDQD